MNTCGWAVLVWCGLVLLSLGVLAAWLRAAPLMPAWMARRDDELSGLTPNESPGGNHV